MLQRIVDGRTDLVFDHLAQGHAATSTDDAEALGENMDLNGAAFHGHWQLCQFLIEHGADVNRPLQVNGETALHSALCKANRPDYDYVVEILLATRSAMLISRAQYESKNW